MERRRTILTVCKILKVYREVAQQMGYICNFDRDSIPEIENFVDKYVYKRYGDFSYLILFIEDNELKFDYGVEICYDCDYPVFNTIRMMTILKDQTIEDYIHKNSVRFAPDYLEGYLYHPHNTLEAY